MFSVCLSVHRGEVPQSGSKTGVPPPLAKTRTGGTTSPGTAHTIDRIRDGPLAVTQEDFPVAGSFRVSLVIEREGP